VRLCSKANSGDYIVASRENDGKEKAFPLKKVPPQLMDKVVGRAITPSSADGMVECIYSFTITQNIISYKFQKHRQKIQHIDRKVNIFIEISDMISMNTERRERGEGTGERRRRY
jgi:hypothetical protein